MASTEGEPSCSPLVTSQRNILTPVSSSELLSVGMKGCCPNPVFMPYKCMLLFPTVDTPHNKFSIYISADDVFPRWRKHHGGDKTLVFSEFCYSGTRCDVPDFKRLSTLLRLRANNSSQGDNAHLLPLLFVLDGRRYHLFLNNIPENDIFKPVFANQPLARLIKKQSVRHPIRHCERCYCGKGACTPHTDLAFV